MLNILHALLENVYSLCLKCYFPCVPDRTRPDLMSEDQQKRFAQEIQNMQTLEVLRQLDDFRSEEGFHTSVFSDIMT